MNLYEKAIQVEVSHLAKNEQNHLSSFTEYIPSLNSKFIVLVVDFSFLTCIFIITAPLSNSSCASSHNQNFDQGNYHITKA